MPTAHLHQRHLADAPSGMLACDPLDDRAAGPLVTWVEAGKPRRAEFAVAASRFSPAWNPENATARDSLLAHIASRLPKP